MPPVRLAPVVSSPARPAVYRLGHRLIGAGQQGPPVEQALDDMAHVTGLERVLLLASSGSGFEVLGARGIEGSAEYLTRAPLAALVATRAAEERQVIYLAEGMELGGLDVAAELRVMDARLVMAVPLALPTPEATRERRRESTEAAPVVVYLETTVARPAPTLSERSIIALVTRQALTGLVASRLFIEAATDTTTGACVRGHFDRALAEEVAWAREAGTSVSALIMALVGGGAGASRERALARAAEVVKASLRTDDIVGRYGPDEMGLILPGAGPSEAQTVARRLAARLAAASLAGYVGAASFPEHAETASQLLSRADQASVAAASSGRPLLWSPGLPEVAGRPERLATLLTGEAAADYRRVQVLLETAQAVNQTRDVAEVTRAALRAVLSLTGADRALVLVGESDSLAIEAGLDKSGEELRPDASFSHSIPRQVLRTGRAVFLRDTAGKVTGESVRTLALRAVLCVPLKAGGRVVGVLYVDSLNAAHELAERDLAFFEAFAAHVALALENARLSEKLRDENAVLKRAQDASFPVEGIIANSQLMRRVLNALPDIAQASAPILILGESGTGKELIARAVHTLGTRKDGPFVAQNCAAIPQDLLESELFGYVPGAFSNASRLKKGLLELAHGGTFFLDEIADLDLLLQAKLLRVLEEKSLRRIGDTRSVPIDLRLVSATNRDLKSEVDAGRFRADLYYRLNVLSVKLPPLRERREDIPILVDHFIARNVRDKGLKLPRLTDEALKALIAYAWPGNVRELMNIVEKSMILCRGGELEAQHLGLDLPAGVPPREGKLHEVQHETERALIRAALDEHAGNVSRAARTLGIARQQLQRLIKKHAIKK